MRRELTPIQSIELTKFSDDPQKYKEYIYTLSDLMLLIPKRMTIDDISCEFLMFIDNGSYVVGYSDKFDYMGGDTIATNIFVEFRNEELVDALYELIMWAFKAFKQDK